MKLTSTLLQTLRHATGDMHESLHQHPLLQPLQRGDITFICYQRILQAFHFAYRAMEGGRKCTLEFPTELPVQALLERDMNIHGVKALPLADMHYPTIDSPGQLVGYLYVKEGSNLGGQVISKQLRRTLGIEAGRNNHFFAGHGHETAARWRDFLTFLHHNEPLVEADTVVAQARASFEMVRRSCDLVAARAQE